MSRLAHRVAAAEQAAMARFARSVDLSHLSDEQLALIERSIDRRSGQWKAGEIALLDARQAELLLDAMASFAHQASAGGKR